ncbi:hypothetical protein Tco_0753772, partial [Tanacetum coccineum]
RKEKLTETANKAFTAPAHVIAPPQNGNSGVEKTCGTGGSGKGTPKSNGENIFGEFAARIREMIERSNDMCSDDIIVESTAGIQKSISDT